MSKKYFWLKLKDDFFNQKEIKKLRKIAGGDTYTIIYLKMQLLSIKNEGKILYEGIEESFEEELSLDLDEDIENIKVTVMFLKRYGLLEFADENNFIMPKAIEAIGSQSDSTERVRRMREKNKQLENVTCNGEVTECNTEKRREEKEIDIKKNTKTDYTLDIEEIRKYYLGTKSKKAADTKLPKLIKKHGKEELIRGIDRYRKFVERERLSFPSLKYKNESTWWSGGYMDYLDENYIEQQKEVQANNSWGGMKEFK